MFKDVIDETKATEGLAQALSAFAYSLRANAEELADTFTIRAELKLTFERKETKS